MKAYWLATRTIFALAGVMHLFALLRGWCLLTSDLAFAIENGLLCAVGLGVATWAFRLVRTLKLAAG